MEQPVFDHQGPWTEESYLALGRGDGQVEVVDGTLFVGPGAGDHRAGVVDRVQAVVRAALPDGLRVRGSVPLRLGPDCILVPDFVVTTGSAPDPDGRPIDAAAALMVIEIVGREHGVTDRSFKPQLYARSRIPYSVLIDHDAPFAVADMIIGGRYHEYATAEASGVLRLQEPFDLELDLAAVTAGPDTPAAEAADGPGPDEPGPDEPAPTTPDPDGPARTTPDSDGPATDGPAPDAPTTPASGTEAPAAR